jgi:hypothetical protein
MMALVSRDIEPKGWPIMNYPIPKLKK